MLRAFFVGLSENKSLRHFAEQSSIGHRVSGRFVAGTEIADAVRATQSINRAGMSVSIDNLGENVTNPKEARHSAELYYKILDAIEFSKLNANISLKLTHMGLDVDENLARELVGGLVAKAASMKPPGFVRVDMEGSPYTQRTLDFVHELHRTPGYGNSVGTVIQAYLKRSQSDVEKLLADGIRIRLCKGAYKEPADIAFAAKSDVDENYLKLTKVLLKSGTYHGLATHDENLIRQIEAFAQQEKIARDSFEFQMLYGIRRDLQQGLVKSGWRVRVYIPFGTEWYPYFMRRLGERPANVFFIARQMLRR
ncbi:MAG: proline dehydrogenase family protein [Candidatus Sulfotelmatobacter sp.]